MNLGGGSYDCKKCGRTHFGSTQHVCSTNFTVEQKIKTYEKQIDDSHPMVSDFDLALHADQIAMELVGERHEKRDLVNLVRWLIMDKASTINADIKSRFK